MLAVIVPAHQQAAAQASLEIHTSAELYSPGQPLLVYGRALPDEGLIVRLFAPDGSIPVFDQVRASSDGTFEHIVIYWSEPTSSLPYGTYAVEVISEVLGSARADARLVPSTEPGQSLLPRVIRTSVFAPETAAIGAPMRVFVQVSSDGLLVAGDPADILASTHVHAPDGRAVALSASFGALHQGLYYADYVPQELGTHVFHVVAFHQGTASHGSAATRVLTEDIGGVSEQLAGLAGTLARTSGELDRLGSEIGGFGGLLGQASSSIDQSIGTMAASVANVETASSQLNALFFPIMALIGVIVALQLAILARRR